MRVMAKRFYLYGSNTPNEATRSLAVVRRATGMSLRRASKVTGFPRRYLAALERGECRLTPPVWIARITTAYVNEIMTRGTAVPSAALIDPRSLPMPRGRAVSHAAVGEAAARHFADEVRAELARQKKSATDMAAALKIEPHTAGRRLNGELPFNVIEVFHLERWLGLAVGELMRRTEQALAVTS